MISEAEVRRLAATLSVDPMIVDLDYVLGCFLSQWYQNPSSRKLRFKGGTCLRKCYFGDYRFSEDLDFTAEAYTSIEELQELVGFTIQRVQDVFTVNLAERPPRFETVNDEYGKESFQVRLYYRGPLQWRGDPRAIRLDLSQEEYLGLAAVEQEIIHPYQDREFVLGTLVPCYDLREMLAEKLRALGGQRRFAIARDLYDVYQLVKMGNIRPDDIVHILPGKFSVKGLDLAAVEPENIEARRDEFETDWERNLQYLLPPTDDTSFEMAWETAREVFRQIS